MSVTREHLAALPKAELHLHVEGTLEPELAFRLAERNGVPLPFAGVDELRAAYDFNDLQSFLDVYYTCMTVLRSRRDFADMARAYLARAHADGVRHVEMFFDPQVHIDNGVALDDVIDGLLDALGDAGARNGMSGGLILCIVRDRPVDSALAVVEEVASRREDLLGIGLDSAEVGFPPHLFDEVFARAGELGLHRVAHAGEEGPPAYITQALDVLGAERIDHGIRAVEDPDLIDRLARERIPLTVCPLSNVRLRAVPDLSVHPIAQLLEAGVRVTVNSDDPAYFGGYLVDNYAALVDALGWTAKELAHVARESVAAAFLSTERRDELFAEIDAWSTAASTTGAS